MSFQALRYEEMWTLVYALVAVSGLADLWSSRLRRRGDHVRAVRVSLLLGAGLIVASVLHLDLDVASLWAPGTRRLAGRLAAEAWPPSAGTVGIGGLVALSLDTLQMSLLGIAAATAGAVPLAFVAARGGGRAREVTALLARAVLLVTRAVPPPCGPSWCCWCCSPVRCPVPPRSPCTTSGSSAA